MRWRGLIGGLVVANVALLGFGAVLAPPPPHRDGTAVHIGLVFDVGGKNDKSFNEAAWHGLQRAQAELGVAIDYIEPTEGADRESALRAMAARKVDLVIGVGFIFGSDLERLAAQFPDVHFAGVDYSPSDPAHLPPNLAGLRFREQEGSFIVGVIAGSLTATKIVGFVGGMKIPLIRKFEVGYLAGVHAVCPPCQVLSAYAGSEPRAFADAPRGQELASAQYEQGADIIFHAAGKTGDGVFAAARQRGARAIGVDMDQYEVAPCCVVTSMVKRVDVAIFDIVGEVVHGTFHGGLRELGIKEGGVDFVSDERNRLLLPPDVVQRARRYQADIVAGKIEVPSE